MEIIIYPYKITQRTEYSKIRLINIETNEDITCKENEELVNNIIQDYNKQIEHKNEYFEIYNTVLLELKDAFRRDHIKYLFVPEGVTQIAEHVIEHEDIILVSLPSSLENISTYAFSSCKNLKHIDIPPSVKGIKLGAFEDCTSLEKVNLPNILEIESSVFRNCSSLKEINIPDSVTILWDSVFSDCNNLKNVKMPKNLEMIYDSTFFGCTKLEKIDLPKSLKHIGNRAFGWTGLKEINIPDDVTCIMPETFLNCENLKYVKLPSNLITLRDKIFYNCRNLEKITLPDETRFLFGNIFESTQIKSVNIPGKLEHICQFPFQNSNVETLIFNHDIKRINPCKIKNEKFSLIYASKINKIVIGRNVKEITSDLFMDDANKITQIDYYGTERQFDNFKIINKNLFELLTKVNNINFLPNLENDFDINNDDFENKIH